jgi:hypothetical protein
MYDDIVDLLDDACASGFASNNRQKKPEASQAILEFSGAPPLTQTSTAASFVIDPVLEAISSEMLPTQGINSEQVVLFYPSISTVNSLILNSLTLIMWAPQTRGSNVLSKG